jgi:hypothetical protein
MADNRLSFLSPEGLVVPVKAVDNGDGTYSLSTSGGGGSTTINITGTLPVSVQGVVPSYDAGPYWTSGFGVTGSAVVSSNITGSTAITDVPTSGQKIVVTDVLLSTDTAMNVLLQEETSGITYAKIFVPANGTIQWTPRSKVKLATANKRLMAKASVTGNVGITAQYYSEA